MPLVCRCLCEDSGLDLHAFDADFLEAARLDGQRDTCSMSSFMQARKRHIA